MAKSTDIIIKLQDGESPQETTRLSLLDQIMPRVNTRLVCCIPLQSSNTEAQIAISTNLEKGLHETLKQIPFLGGIIGEDQDGSDKVHITPGPGVLFRTRDLTDDTSFNYQNLRDKHFPLSSFDGEVLIPVGMMPSGSMPPVMAAQASFVLGGLLLAVGIHHSIMDAAGLGTLLRTWAVNVRVSTLGGSSSITSISLPSTSTDRVLLQRFIKNADFDPIEKIKDHPQYKIENNPQPPVRSDDESPPPPPKLSLPPMTVAIFHFSATDLAQLKSSQTPSSAGSYISTNDALCALLWHSIVKARNLALPSYKGEETPQDGPCSMLGFAVDGRTRLSPSLPQTYLGNVNIYSSISLPISSLISSSTLPDTAAAIRSAVMQVDSPRIHDILALIAALPVPTALKPGFNSFLGLDLAITSWRNMGVLGLDWGIGKVERVRIPKAEFDGLCILMEAEGGGVEVVVGLEKVHMERLRSDKVFMRFSEFRGI